MKRSLSVSLSTLTLALSLISIHCSSPPKAVDRPEPAWIHEPSRRVDNGYIIYIGSGEDTTLERAHFKATSMALQDLVNECSLASKGTRIEDGYDHPEGSHQFRAYAKVAIEFQDCETAKQSVEPDQIRKLASVPLTEQLKRYQQMIDEPMPEEIASNDSGDNEGVNPMVNSGYTPQPSYGGAWRTRVVVINNPDSYFWMRQQVAYDKQIVVLAPPTQYQAGTQQTQAFVQSVRPAATQIQTFEKTNPETKTWNKSYSQSPARQARIMQQHQAKALARPARGQPRFNPGSRGRGKSLKQSPGPQRGRGRRKKRWDQN